MGSTLWRCSAALSIRRAAVPRLGSRVMRKYREDDDGFKENALHGVL
ncbi:hypothetical protein ACWCQL_13155 [Streptomyces sp. NPDC002073]